MVSNLILNSTGIKPPYGLLVHKNYLSNAVARQFRTSYYDDYSEKIAVQTAQDGTPRRVARVDELMALSHRRTIAMMFNKNARELSELQLWEGLGKIPKVQRDTDVDSDELQRDLKSLLRSSVSCSLSDNLAQVTGGLVEYLENNLTSAMMDDDGSWLKDLGKIVARLWTVGLQQHPRFQLAVHRRCQFLSAEGDPGRVIEVTSRWWDISRRLNSFSGLVYQWATGKSLMLMATRYPLGLQPSRLDQARRRLRHS